MLTYYQNSISKGMNLQPNEAYRQLEQARINDQWENTSARYTVLEQDEIGSAHYTEIEAWLNYVVGQTSTGVKSGEDFCQLAFQDITHPCIRGRYYQFDNNIWLTYFTDDHDSLSKTLAVRRCNNALRWVNPENGAIETVPCVVDYDMSSPSMQVTSSILTPNNHATVMIQGNNLTNSQLKTNMRFVLGGRPFKLYGYQNALLYSQLVPSPTLLYLDLYLDEKQANDNFENSIAFNGYYNYTIIPSQMSIEVLPNSTGTLTANAELNGDSIVRPFVWESPDSEKIQIDNNGNYTVSGVVGDEIPIKVYIEGNPANVQTITVDIVDAIADSFDISLSPIPDKIKQYENIKFIVEIIKNSQSYSNFNINVSLSQSENILSDKFLSIEEIDNNSFGLTCNAFDSTPKNIYLTVIDNESSITYNKVYSIKTVNMFG